MTTARARLLILPASVGDGPRHLPQPAYRRYTGRLWQAFRAAEPAMQGRVHVAYVASIHGFGDAADPSRPHYAEPMAVPIEQALIAGGIDRPWPNPAGTSAHAVMSTMLAADQQEDYARIAVIGNAQHQRIVLSLLRAFQGRGQIAPTATVRTQSGSWMTMAAAVRDFVMFGDSTYQGTMLRAIPAGPVARPARTPWSRWQPADEAYRSSGW